MMRRHKQFVRVFSPAGRLSAPFATALVAGLTWPVAAHAIPSPELVVGSISSVSQLIALVSAMLGGGAAAVGVRASLKRGAGPHAGRGAFRLAAVMILAFAVSAGFNVYQYVTYESERQARLQATLVRPARLPGTRILDPTLKETSYKDQARHPLGMPSNEAARLLAQMRSGKRKDVVFLDIREDAENEMGTLPGARHIRFPDLTQSGLDLAGKKAILFCHNGNRSSETCEKLARMGIDCRFLIGGIEKWIVEGRPFTDKSVRSLSDLRAIPDYPRRDVLLDTPDVHRLVNEEGAIFVDVRYPGEFAVQHLPGAVNIPLRRTPTAELNRMIASLPKKPIVAACYDRRGCFASQVLGLELTRAGHDFRGRYTLPWEYFVRPEPKPHIKAWMAAQNRGLWDKAVDLVARGIDYLAGKWGFLLAILIAALISRLLVLPLSLKAERDQIRMRAVGDELDALKARLADDPKRMSRAMRAFYRRHGLTPGRNALALLFLPLMALALTAVRMVAEAYPQPFLWIGDLSARDPLFILPVIFGVLIAIYLDICFVKTHRHRLYVWLLAMPALTGLALVLSAAGNVYLIASAVLLLVQRAWVTGQFALLPRMARAMARRWRAWRARSGIVPLAHGDQLAACGNKSYRLAQLRAHGIPVPDGVVLTTALLDRFDRLSDRRRRRILDRIWRRLAAERVAVRSSASAEDGSLHSFAGVFESVLDVERAGLEAAIREVMQSFRSERAGSYGIEGSDANILVQRMIDADYAGVLFTRDPEAPGMVMVEMVEGTADKLVSGTAQPETYRFGRHSDAPMGEAEPPIDLAPLLAIGRKVEALFGAPQDVEWTYLDGRFQIVQSRDITTLGKAEGGQAVIEEEWSRIFARAKDADPEEILFEQTEMSEVLPRPTPLSLSLMESLWASGGSVDLACRRLGLAYPVEEDSPSHLVTLFGRLYIDRRQERKNAVSLNRAAIMRLNKGARDIEAHFLESFLPAFREEMNVLEIANFDRLGTDDLFDMVARLRDDFVTHTHVEVEIINIAASFYIEQAKEAARKAGLDPARLLVGAADSTPARSLAAALREAPEKRRDMLLETFRHRAVFDYELADARYGETPTALDSLCVTSSAGSAQADGEGHVDEGLAGLEPKLAEAIRRARRYQVLKEDAKHHSLRQLAVLRHVLMALDRRLNLVGLIFHLTFDEIARLRSQGVEAMRPIAQERRERMRLLGETERLATALSLVDLERASSHRAESEALGERSLKGTRVAGSGMIEGRARVVPPGDAEDGSPIVGFEDGDIIVCSMVHPAWLPYVLRAGGVVCEVGGWLSHIAIVAREHGIAMHVGVKGLRAIPQEGAVLRLHEDGQVEVVERDARAAEEAVTA